MNTYFEYPYSAIRNEYHWPEICIPNHFLRTPICLKPLLQFYLKIDCFTSETNEPNNYILCINFPYILFTNGCLSF